MGEKNAQEKMSQKSDFFSTKKHICFCKMNPVIKSRLAEMGKFSLNFYLSFKIRSYRL